MKISVIIPIYNGEVHLARCLDSLATQSLSDIEFLLLDDGSTDKTRDLCNEYVSNDVRFKYFYHDNEGVSATRNYGLEYATGEYIAFCDCDDWADNDLYETLYSLAIQKDSDVAVVSFYDDFGTVVDDFYTRAMTGYDAWKMMLNNYSFSGFVWNKLFKRELLSGMKFSSKLKLYEDMVFCGEAFGKANSVVFQNSQKYHYISSFGRGKVRNGYETALDACDILSSQSLEYFSQVLPELKALYISTYVSVANKGAVLGKLSKIDYEKYRDAIRNYNTSGIQLNESIIKKIKLFNAGYFPFKLFCKLYARKQ